MTDEQKRLLDLHNWQVGQQLGAGQTWMVPITGETVGGMPTADLEAHLAAFRAQDAANLAAYQERGRLASEAWRSEARKCSPSRSDCPGFS